MQHVRTPNAIYFPTAAQVPETRLHFELRTALFLILKREFASRACVGSDQFVYWNAKDPRRCLAPDVFVKLGTGDERFDSWKTWERGAPELAVEILSENEAWEEKLDRYHELGVRELVSFDPDSARYRVWDRIDEDLVERKLPRSTTARSTPCVPLGGFWVVAMIGDLRGLRLARDSRGTDLYLTPEEANYQQLEAKDRQIAKLQAALARRSQPKRGSRSGH